MERERERGSTEVSWKYYAEFGSREVYFHVEQFFLSPSLSVSLEFRDFSTNTERHACREIFSKKKKKKEKRMEKVGEKGER